jgi:hypothetical protein
MARGGKQFPLVAGRGSGMSTKPIATTVKAKLPKREGEFVFSKASVKKAPNGEFVVELADEAGHALHVAFKGADLKSLIGWRLLVGL